MKQDNIIEGKEYAYFFASYARSNPDRVKVIEKGLKLGLAKGRGVKVDFLDGRQPDRTVNAVHIRYAWKDWLEKEKEQKKSQAQREARLNAALVAKWDIEGQLNKADIGHTISYNANGVTVKLATSSAANLAALMERAWNDESNL